MYASKSELLEEISGLILFSNIIPIILIAISVTTLFWLIFTIVYAYRNKKNDFTVLIPLGLHNHFPRFAYQCFKKFRIRYKQKTPYKMPVPSDFLNLKSSPNLTKKMFANRPRFLSRGHLNNEIGKKNVRLSCIDDSIMTTTSDSRLFGDTLKQYRLEHHHRMRKDVAAIIASTIHQKSRDILLQSSLLPTVTGRDDDSETFSNETKETPPFSCNCHVSSPLSTVDAVTFSFDETTLGGGGGYGRNEEFSRLLCSNVFSSGTDTLLDPHSIPNTPLLQHKLPSIVQGKECDDQFPNHQGDDSFSPVFVTQCGDSGLNTTSLFGGLLPHHLPPEQPNFLEETASGVVIYEKRTPL